MFERVKAWVAQRRGLFEVQELAVALSTPARQVYFHLYRLERMGLAHRQGWTGDRGGRRRWSPGSGDVPAKRVLSRVPLGKVERDCLMALADGKSTVRDIEDWTGRSAMRVWRALASLTRRGFAMRVSDHKAFRRMTWAITDAGRDASPKEDV